MKKMKLVELITINLYWFGLSVMWNSIHPLVLPAILLHVAPSALKNTVLGLLTFGGLIIAMIVQPISGAVSDSWRSKLGRRRPLAITGTGLDLLFLSLLAWSGNLAIIALGYVGLQFSSNIAHGPMQGLIPDNVPDDQIGIASGIKNLTDMAGLIIASLVAGQLLSPEDRYPTIIMLVVIVVLVLCSLVTFLTTKEKSTACGGTYNLLKLDIKNIFITSLKENASYFWLIASRFIFLTGIYGIQTFAQYYIRDVMQVVNPVKATGDLMASLVASLVIFSMLGGWLSDKIGGRRIMYIGTTVSAVGTLLIAFAGNIAILTVFAGIFGAGVGLYLSSNWAYASRLAPTEEAGKYLGLTNLATAGGSALSKLGGILIDAVNNMSPGKYYGYTMLFIIGSIFAVVSMLLLKRVRWLDQSV